MQVIDVTSLMQVCCQVASRPLALSRCLKSVKIKLDSISFLQTCCEYTRKDAQVVTSLQTSCNKSVHTLSTSGVRTVCS